jgi:hypothetical protein
VVSTRSAVLFITVASVASAACLGGGKATVSEDNEASRGHQDMRPHPAEGDLSPDASLLTRKELSNETLRFARTGGGASASTYFQVPEHTVRLIAYLWLIKDCPVGRQDGARLQLLPEDAGAVDLVPTNESSWAHPTCLPGQTMTEPVRQFPLKHVAAGSWKVTPLGECTCSVRAAILAWVEHA